MKNFIKILRNGGVGVIPTDTIYGLVGSAFSNEVFERIAKLKNRDKDQAFIILISNTKDLEKFGVSLTHPMCQSAIEKYWPGPVSLILPYTNKKYDYLSREGETLSFRLPNNEKLIEILRQTGPLIAPSANQKGEPPATTIKEAKKYFKNEVDFYIEGGTLNNSASKIIKIEDGEEVVIR